MDSSRRMNRAESLRGRAFRLIRLRPPPVARTSPAPWPIRFPVCSRCLDPRTRVPIRVALFLSLITALPVPALAQLRPQQLEQLLEEGKSEEAYELAREHRAELEGELLFDFYYGLAAIGSGHVSEGVFALERVIMRRPAFGRARLALGRGYFLLEEYRRAEEHFSAALAQDPPTPIRNTIERYRQKIRERSKQYSTVVTGYIGAGGGSDSNVNSATDNDTIDSILGPLTLSPGSQELDDSFARVEAGVQISRPLADDITGFARLDLDERRYSDEDDFDRRRVDGRIGSTFSLDRWQASLSGRLQRFYVGDDVYQDLWGVGVNAAYRLSSTTSLVTGLQVSEIDNEISDNLDSTLLILSGGVTKVWNARFRPVGSVSVFAGTEDADEDTNAANSNTTRDMVGFAGQLRLQFNPEWSLASRFQFRSSEYDERNLLLNETRDEDYYQIEFDLFWSPNPHWRVGPSLLASENDANTDLHEYDRTTLEVSARYSFF